MEIEIDNINVIIYSMIIAIVILFIKKRPSRFKKGVIVANTKYVKNTKYYKKILLKSRIFNFAIMISLFILVLMNSLILAKVKIVNYKEETHKEIIPNNVMIYIEDDYNYLPDMQSFEHQIDGKKIDKLKNVVNELDNKKIGIVYRNNSHICSSRRGVCLAEEYKNTGKDHFWRYQNLPVVLSSFSQNKLYTQYVLDSLKKINDDNLFQRLQIPWWNIDAYDPYDKDLVNLAKEEIKVFEYITAHFLHWGNVWTFSGLYPGLPSGQDRYTNKYMGYYALADVFDKNKNEKFDSRMSYLDFINERFENVGNDNKIVIWYNDYPEIDIKNELKKNEAYLNENKMTILPLDNYTEEQLINEVKKLSNKHSKEITVTNKEVVIDDNIIEKIIPIFIIIVFLLFIFEWRLGI